MVAWSASLINMACYDTTQQRISHVIEIQLLFEARILFQNNKKVGSGLKTILLGERLTKVSYQSLNTFLIS